MLKRRLLQGRIVPRGKDLSNAISNKPTRCVDKTKDGGERGEEDRSTQEEERLEEGAVKPENRAWSRERARGETILEQGTQRPWLLP